MTEKQITTYGGVTYESRAALARHLAPKLGRSARMVALLLAKYGDDVERVIRYYRSAPRRRSRVPILHGGHTFPTRLALARHLAPQLGRSMEAVEQRLLACRDDADEVLRLYRLGGRPSPWFRPITYGGHTFPTRRALARQLALKTGRPVQLIGYMLRKHHDDVDAALDAALKVGVIVCGTHYPSKIAFICSLSSRCRIPESTLQSWAARMPLDEVLEKARQHYHKEHPRLRREEIVLFGWRFHSFNALCRYYDVPHGGPMRREFEEHLASGRPGCLFMPLANSLTKLWRFGELDEWNRRTTAAEAQLPKSALPLNVKPEEIADATERSWVDALQPPGAMTLRRGIMRGEERLQRMLSGEAAAAAPPRPKAHA